MWGLVSITIVSTFPSEELERRGKVERTAGKKIRRDEEIVAGAVVVRGLADENRRLLS